MMPSTSIAAPPRPGLTTRILVTLFFIGLLATPYLVRHFSAASQTAPASTDRQAALARYGFYLEEVSHASGIDFVHQAPVLDSKLAAIMPEVTSMGAAVSIVDFDRDGWPDIYVTNSAIGSKNHLYHNNHDGTFTDVAEQMGVADVNQSGTGVSMGAVWGDYDNDGYEDLFLTKWGRPELYHNDHGHGFTRVTDQAGLPPWINANTAVWLDYDGDGKLDLFVGGYYPENLDLWHLHSTRVMPDSFEYAKNGGRKYLFHNLGNGHLKKSAKRLGSTATVGRLPRQQPICAERGIPTFSSPMTTASPSSISTMASNFAKPVRTPGSDSRPRAA